MTPQTMGYLPIIHFYNLASPGPEQKVEIEKLLRVTQDLGFFYLDLRNNSGTESPILELRSRLFEVAKDLFDLPAAEKSRYDVKTNGGYFGYKGMGKSFVDQEGTPDINEFYNISKDDMLSQNGVCLAHPPIMQVNRALFASFLCECHQLTQTILSILSENFSETPARDSAPGSLPNLHRLGARSGDQISLIKYPVFDSMPSTQPLASHTDYGSLTILFTSAPGLQVQTSDDKGKVEWINVDPKDGCAIVNCGDALSIFRAAKIRSNLHRVQSHVARGSTVPRYSVGYFCRPEDEVYMRALPGFKDDGSGDECGDVEKVKSKDWVMRRSYGRLIENFDGEPSWQRTGGTELNAKQGKDKQDV